MRTGELICVHLWTHLLWGHSLPFFLVVNQFTYIFASYLEGNMSVLGLHCEVLFFVFTEFTEQFLLFVCFIFYFSRALGSGSCKVKTWPEYEDSGLFLMVFCIFGSLRPCHFCVNHLPPYIYHKTNPPFAVCFRPPWRRHTLITHRSHASGVTCHIICPLQKKRAVACMLCHTTAQISCNPPLVKFIIAGEKELTLISDLLAPGCIKADA